MPLPNVNQQDATLAIATEGALMANEMDKAEDLLREMDYTLTSVFDSLVDLVRVNQRIAKAVEGLFEIQQEQYAGERLQAGLDLESTREEVKTAKDPLLGFKLDFNTKKIKESASTLGLVIGTLGAAMVAFYDELPEWAKDLIRGRPGATAKAEAEKRYPPQLPEETPPPTNMSQTIQDVRDSLSPFGTDEKKLERTFGNIRTQDEFNQFYRGFNRESGSELSQRLNTHLTEGEKEKYIEPTLRRLGVDPDQFFAGKYQPTPANVSAKQKVIEAFRYMYYENKEYDWMRNARPIAEEIGMEERPFIKAVTGNDEYGYEAWSRVSDMPVIPEMFPNTIEALTFNGDIPEIRELTVAQHSGKEMLITQATPGSPIPPPPPKSKMDALGLGVAASGKIDRSSRPANPSANPNVTKSISESSQQSAGNVNIINDNSDKSTTVINNGGGKTTAGRSVPDSSKKSKTPGSSGSTELTDWVNGPF